MPEQGGRVRYLRIAGVLGGLAVCAGAFGAHGLESRLDTRELEIWETAARYQMYHALSMLAFAGAVMKGTPGRAALWACRAWFAGVLVFSGTLYLLALSEVRWLGAITPLGGVALMMGWGLAAWTAGSESKGQ